MGFLERILGPGHSIIIAFDHVDLETLEEVTEALDEVGQYYRFAPLSKIAAASQTRRARGYAAIVFRHARVSVFLRAIPELKARGVPFSLLLDPDCIGGNRLPIGEELGIYRAQEPEKAAAFGGAWLENAWREGRTADSLREELRKVFGPLPVEKLDPTRFFSTWGKIAELPAESVELGLNFDADPSSETARLTVDYARKTSDRTLCFGFFPYSCDADRAARLGMKFALTTRGGIVGPRTSLWEMPLFALEKHEPPGKS